MLKEICIFTPLELTCQAGPTHRRCNRSSKPRSGREDGLHQRALRRGFCLHLPLKWLAGWLALMPNDLALRSLDCVCFHHVNKHGFDKFTCAQPPDCTCFCSLYFNFNGKAFGLAFVAASVDSIRTIGAWQAMRSRRSSDRSPQSGVVFAPVSLWQWSSHLSIRWTVQRWTLQ